MAGEPVDAKMISTFVTDMTCNDIGKHQHRLAKDQPSPSIHGNTSRSGFADVAQHYKGAAVGWPPWTAQH